MSFRLKRGESPSDGVRRIAREQAEQAVTEATATDRDTAPRVHDVRKCTKKLRSLLRLSRPHLGDQYRVENSLLRDAARRLSASRDAAVILATFDALVKKQSDVHRPGSAAVREVFVGSLSEHSAADSVEMQLAAFAEDIRGLLERIGEWTIDENEFAAIGDGLVRSYRDGRRAMRMALRSSDASDWHEWRKRVKDHWYHVRLLRNVWKPVMMARQKAVGSLSDLLGEDHDLAVLHERLTRLHDAPSEPTLQLLQETVYRRERLQSAASSLGARIYAEKPKALKNRVSRYWRIWRAET